MKASLKKELEKQAKYIEENSTPLEDILENGDADFFSSATERAKVFNRRLYVSKESYDRQERIRAAYRPNVLGI